MNTRYIPSALMASAITFSLFFTMQFLVKEDKRFTPPRVLPDFNFSPRIPIDEYIDRTIRAPEKPEEVVDTPPTPTILRETPLRPGVFTIPIEKGPTETVLETTDFGISDGDIIPLTKVAPSYPPRAAERGIEGSVVLEFRISKTGAVENIRVIEANPPGYFERASTKALAKFKYKPRIINGQAVAVEGVRHIISFEMPK